ncbi:MAG: DUF3883 domain-containing protein [Planctomycetes bacterium]|nr:DUF3883 domain-containing protein [Planctomycetota bacterium]
MARLEELTRGAQLKGVLPSGLVTVIDVKWHGSGVVEITYKDAGGRLGNELIYRDREPALEIATAGGPWSFDGDRFEGKFRDGAHQKDAADLMRRLLKEKLLKFDGTPLFPERLAYTVTYRLSDLEAALYAKVTEYVRQEFNRADALESEGRKGTVGFALTILQRRLASSPEAIYQSLKRRRERLEARRLQPHFIAGFFLEALKRLGGAAKGRESKRFEITHVPSAIRNRDRIIGCRDPVLPRYERITFEKTLVSVAGKPLAEFVCPGHPLLDATLDLILERHRDLLKRGAILVDEQDPGERARALYYLEHSIQDARADRSGGRRIISREVRFVEIDDRGRVRSAGHAPHLVYRPLVEAERQLAEPILDSGWLKDRLEDKVLSYAIAELVPRHFGEIQRYKEELIAKTAAAVKDRLTKEISYWDHRAEDLKAQELAGKTPRLNSVKARQRADDLQARLQRRLAELEEERKLSPLPPVVMGGALILPRGLLLRLKGEEAEKLEEEARETERVERLAMAAVLEEERRLGFEPRDVSSEDRGYDIESRVPGAGKLRFLEVKGRASGADTVTVTKNEILTGLNKPEDFILAIVQVEGEAAGRPRYVRQPFQNEPDFAVSSVNYKLRDLLERAEEPA